MSASTEGTNADASVQDNGERKRLWTPWRMRYVTGGAKEAGCIFCNRLASSDDTASLILHRDAHALVIMNLFPYNTAHLMIVPTAHVSSPEEATELELARLGTLLKPVTRALRRVLSCDGFNVGFNVGATAGAGVAQHLHQHVVPRWTGDANFMPILAGTMVLPELIPVTYAKVRAELRRELLPPDAPRRDDVLVVATAGGGDVLLQSAQAGAQLPRFHAEPDQPLWQAALRGVSRVAAEPEIVGWAGASSTRDDRAPVLHIHCRGFAAGNEAGFVVAPNPDALRSLASVEDSALLTALFAVDQGD